MSTKKKTTIAKSKVVDTTEDILFDFNYLSYPYDLSTCWKPLNTVLEDLCLDQNISFHYLRKEGLIDKTGRWSPCMTENGLVTQISFLEEDLSTGYSEEVILNLVSHRGFHFLETFFEMIQS